MHEFAICQSIVEAALCEVEKLDPPPRKLLNVRVVTGALRQIIPEYLAFAYETLTKDTFAEGSTIEVVQVPAAARCRSCGWQGQTGEDIFRCTECGSTDLEIEGGKELYLESIEVEQDDEPEH